MRGSVASEITVPKVNISDANREFLPYLTHWRVQRAAGGAAAATMTVRRTFSSMCLDSSTSTSERMAGNNNSFRKHTQYTLFLRRRAGILVSDMVMPATIMATGVFSSVSIPIAFAGISGSLMWKKNEKRPITMEMTVGE